jgi:hypothetical protein
VRQEGSLLRVVKEPPKDRSGRYLVNVDSKPRFGRPEVSFLLRDGCGTCTLPLRRRSRGQERPVTHSMGPSPTPKVRSPSLISKQNVRCSAQEHALRCGAQELLGLAQ